MRCHLVNKILGAALLLALAVGAQTAAFQEGESYRRQGDLKSAAQCYLRGARQGDPVAQLQLGWFYETGQGVDQSWDDAVTWYTKAAKAGNPVAMKNLGQFYENGTGVPQDWVAAARWYGQSAQRDEADGEAALARAYQFGMGVPQNRAQAIYWDQKAAGHGDSHADYWARWLSDPAHDVGFRSDDEAVGGPLPEPVGQTFHNAQERAAWADGVRRARSADDAEIRRERGAAQARHEEAVRRLVQEGYSREEAERRAGW